MWLVALGVACVLVGILGPLLALWLAPTPRGGRRSRVWDDV